MMRYGPASIAISLTIDHEAGTSVTLASDVPGLVSDRGPGGARLGQTERCPDSFSRFHGTQVFIGDLDVLLGIGEIIS